MTPRFPFGQPSLPRPPRRPSGDSRLFVLGVYPSALHVRWDPPRWAREELGIGPVGALAVDNEPIVFWDGQDADKRVQQWRAALPFDDGDEPGQWGHVRASGNGTSGDDVANRVLSPLGVKPEETWFTDAVNEFFVKRGSGTTRGQADAIREEYDRLAPRIGLLPAELPERPSPKDLVKLAVSQHGPRLRAEFQEAGAPTVVTLGEEARQVLAALTDSAVGPPTEPLDSKQLIPSSYGEVGTATIGGQKMAWHALVHPGQRSTAWTDLHDEWIRRQSHT